jgi:hypothetical protein
MVVFDLECGAGHRFEGWFDDIKDLKTQIKKGLVVCPVCGDDAVRQVPASFGISKSGRNKVDQSEQDRMSQALTQAAQHYFMDNFENVGAGFAKEALKIHYGAAEERNIRGVSSEEEEKMLKEEGVSFFKVGLPRDASAGDEDAED